MGLKNKHSQALYLILLAIHLLLRLPEISAQINDSSSTVFVPTGTNLVEDSENVTDHSQYSDETVRVDPLDSFNKYRGGFDITNKHYWTSTIFTGVCGYALGILWLMCGILYGGFLSVKSVLHTNTKKKSSFFNKKSACHKHCYLWPILLAILFTLLAIVASGVVLGGNARFHSEAKSVVDIIIDTANEASQTIYNTTGAMRDIRDNLGASGGNAEAASLLTSTTSDLDTKAADIHRHAKKNRQMIDKGLKIVFIVTTTIIVINLVAVMALSVCGILRFQRALRTLIVLCWFLTVLCWFFFGMYFFLDRFAGDTCDALNGFQRNPYNSSLTSILPCDELVSAKAVLHDVSAGIHNLVDEVNANISRRQPSFAVSVCNPFSEPPEYLYQPENCPSTAIRIADIPKVLQVFTCSDAGNASCGTGEFTISDEEYKTAESYSSSITSLLSVYPGMESLVECQTVKDAFSEILTEHCRPLKKFIRMVSASTGFLSVLMVALVLLWSARDHHEMSHHFSGGVSVGSHSSAAKELELGSSQV